MTVGSRDGEPGRISPGGFEDHKGARDRMRAAPNDVFAQRILEPIFEFNCRHNFYPLIDAHRAWLTMLGERQVVHREAAAAILRGLEELEREGPDSVRPFDAGMEYFYLRMERALVRRVPGGEAAVGNLNLGRTRPEPLHRTVARDAILRVLRGALAMRRTLLDRAEAEAETVMPGYTHLLHAQPTTLGHTCSRSRTTSSAIRGGCWRRTRPRTSARWDAARCPAPVCRSTARRVLELLGFARLRENTGARVRALAHGAHDRRVDRVLRRAAQRRLHMDTEEVEIESYVPLFDAFELTELALPTIDAVVVAMQPDRELMRHRAAWGFSSVTALAERIQTDKDKDLSYDTAHRIVARAVLLAVERGRDATGIDAELLDLAAHEMIGEPLQLAEQAIRACLDPRSFVDEHAVTGGPAPLEARRMAGERRQRLASDERDVSDREEVIARSRKGCARQRNA